MGGGGDYCAYFLLLVPTGSGADEGVGADDVLCFKIHYVSLHRLPA